MRSRPLVVGSGCCVDLRQEVVDPLQPLLDGVAEEAGVGHVEAVLRRRRAGPSRSPWPGSSASSLAPSVGSTAPSRTNLPTRRGRARRRSRPARCRRRSRSRSSPARRGRRAARPCRGRPRRSRRVRPGRPECCRQPRPRARALLHELAASPQGVEGPGRRRRSVSSVAVGEAVDRVALTGAARVEADDVEVAEERLPEVAARAGRHGGAGRAGAAGVDQHARRRLADSSSAGRRSARGCRWSPRRARRSRGAP